ncbi:MAG: hypothetical protein LCH95_24235 [Proteobacteria bacterium]|nr:hypothetical protein [Pseudomonadota bacterium]
MTFDPVRKRQFWLDFALKYETEFVPDKMPPQGQPLYVSVLTNSLVTGFLLGLADRVRPTLEAIVTWMESRPEPSIGLYSGPRDFWHDDYYAIYVWRRTLGLAKWLCGMEGSETHFAQALSAEWDCWHKATPAQLQADNGLRRQRLSEHLALALAAKQPDVGLYFYQAEGPPDPKTLPALEMAGVYGCLRLKDGEARTADFRREAEPLLKAGLWEEHLVEGRLAEPAFWMKFLYFDSDVARTPERALARLYEFMPGVKRPDFVDR